MIKIMTAINNPNLNEELKKENNVEIVCKDIQYKEGILEILENNIKIDFIIIDENLPGEIELEKLIEEILEKNEKIKIIITIKKENKNKKYFDNKKIIKIIYENKINLDKIKNYKKYMEEINTKEKIKISKKIENEKTKEIKYNINISKIKSKINKLKINNIKTKNKKSKIITILGEEKVGKSMTIINFAYYFKNKNLKTLIIELNKKDPSIYTIFGYKKSNIKIKKEKIKIKRYKKYEQIKIKYKKIYLNEKIIKKMITKINKNIDIISYSKIINYKIIKKLEKDYNYILIEIPPQKINKKILNNSDIKILLIRPNLLGIKNSKKIIEKNNIYNINNIKIILNNYNKYSINEKIIKNIFNENKIIGKILYKKQYENLINKNLKSLKINQNNKKTEINSILEKII